jgi:pilus assembly protein CpaF
MRPDRIIVGEVRGGEALDMLQAMNTGHDGSLATVHANSPYDALSRIETLASMSDVEIPFAAIRDQVNDAIDMVVQLARFADGTRRIIKIASVVSERRQDYRLQTLVDYDGIGRQFLRYPAPDRLVKALTLAGETLPSGWTAEVPA